MRFAVDISEKLDALVVLAQEHVFVCFLTTYFVVIRQLCTLSYQLNPRCNFEGVHTTALISSTNDFLISL